jgi:hypothetical protein
VSFSRKQLSSHEDDGINDCMATTLALIMDHGEIVIMHMIYVI